MGKGADREGETGGGGAGVWRGGGGVRLPLARVIRLATNFFAFGFYFRRFRLLRIVGDVTRGVDWRDDNDARRRRCSRRPVRHRHRRHASASTLLPRGQRSSGALPAARRVAPNVGGDDLGSCTFLVTQFTLRQLRTVYVHFAVVK